MYRKPATITAVERVVGRRFGQPFDTPYAHIVVTAPEFQATYRAVWEEVQVGQSVLLEAPDADTMPFEAWTVRDSSGERVIDCYSSMWLLVKQGFGGHTTVDMFKTEHGAIFGNTPTKMLQFSGHVTTEAYIVPPVGHDQKPYYP